MRLFNSAKDYGAIAQTLHWLTVFLVVLAWVLGVFGDVLPKGGPRQTGLFVHISAGIAILALLGARLSWRRVDPTPPTEATEFGARMGRWLDPAAGIAHYSLYALLFAVPVAGIVLQFARGDALPFFGLAEISSPWLKDPAFAHSGRRCMKFLPMHW